MTGPRFRYSRWDGTQTGFDLDADAVFAEVADDLLYHGDLSAALRRLMQSGLRSPDGQRLPGVREMLERLRARRREELSRHGVGDLFADANRRLEEILEAERAGIERAEQQAAADAARRDDPQAAAAAAERAAAQRMDLDLLPPDLPGRLSSLARHDWADSEAKRRYEELVEELRSELLSGWFNRISEGMRNLDDAQLARMKDMLAELNQMLEQRARGEEPDFAGFMSRHGDFFPGNPGSLDELLEQMARSMAAMSRLLAAMTPEQRAELARLSQALLEDLDLRWQMDELARNLADAFPQLPWNRPVPLQGDEPMPFGSVAEMLSRLGDLDQLEHLLSQATQPGQLAEVDLERAAELLGDDAARSLDQLARVTRMLTEAGLIDQREGRLELTARGIRALGQRALGDLFRHLSAERLGGHDAARAGIGHERTFEHKPYAFGDPFTLDVGATVRNAISRAGPGTPVRLAPVDFEVSETELLTRSATVLALDVSLSMPMRDNFLPAKKVAMALHALITARFPRDHFGIVAFGRVAREVRPEDLPEMSWDFEWGTNMQHALMLARRQLARHAGTRQVILVTDGEPTAHIEGGEAVFEYPPSPVTIAETLREVTRCTRAGIRINTFMLDESLYLRDFVERMMRLNRGRAFFTTPESLGDYVLVDFLDQRRTRRRRAG